MASCVLGFCPVFAKCVAELHSSICFLPCFRCTFLNCFDSNWKWEGHRTCIMWLVQSEAWQWGMTWIADVYAFAGDSPPKAFRFQSDTLCICVLLCVCVHEWLYAKSLWKWYRTNCSCEFQQIDNLCAVVNKDELISFLVQKR